MLTQCMLFHIRKVMSIFNTLVTMRVYIVYVYVLNAYIHLEQQHRVISDGMQQYERQQHNEADKQYTALCRQQSVQKNNSYT